MAEWKEQANARREFRQSRAEPETPRRKGRKKKPARNFAVHTKLWKWWMTRYYENADDAIRQHEKNQRMGHETMFEVLAQPQPEGSES